ncbi:MAG: ABC transporter ATP-binding protein [Deltaproteobacteria bacterium]|nr:ABC transporter ATP-binding protein [Deltaproteobacteria bacterium]
MKLTIENLTKSYGEVKAVNDFNIVVETGKLLVLLGPSGCGKTTTLRCIAGFEKPDTGRITIGDKVVTDPQNGINLPSEKRGLGMVFQSYAIWPHMTVFDNVAYGLKMRKWPRAKIKERVEQMLVLTGLHGLAGRPAPMLSGGQMQRVALARNLAYRPDVMLLDEPLSNLDSKLRERLRFELREIQLRVGFTAVYVTHDQSEAVSLADEIILMKDGLIEQQGTAEDLFNKPKSAFVADFIGSANLVPAVVKGEENNFYLLETPERVQIKANKNNNVFNKGQSVKLVMRPENIYLSKEKRDGWSVNTWQGDVVVPNYLGTQTRYVISLNSRRLFVTILGSTQAFQANDKVYVYIPPEEIKILEE